MPLFFPFLLNNVLRLLREQEIEAEQLAMLLLITSPLIGVSWVQGRRKRGRKAVSFLGLRRGKAFIHSFGIRHKVVECIREVSRVLELQVVISYLCMYMFTVIGNGVCSTRNGIPDTSEHRCQGHR